MEINKKGGSYHIIATVWNRLNSMEILVPLLLIYLMLKVWNRLNSMEMVV